MFYIRNHKRFLNNKDCLISSGDVPADIEWKRASELSAEPQLICDGASRFDINQVSTVFLPLIIYTILAINSSGVLNIYIFRSFL